MRRHLQSRAALPKLPLASILDRDLPRCLFRRVAAKMVQERVTDPDARQNSDLKP
jgi:hypothetical protein